jgi:putative transcriptional regulator
MSAILSPCSLYRYKLEREVNQTGKLVIAYFGVNPSTADASNDDQTVEVKISDELVISPDEIMSIRQQFNMSRGVFANYLHTSARTLENWEQVRSAPNGQAVTLLKLVKSYPETLSHIATL